MRRVGRTWILPGYNLMTPKQLRYGLGLRPAHYDTILRERPSVDFFEALSEDYIDLCGEDFLQLEKIRQHYPVVLHGVSLSIGSMDALNERYLKALKALITIIEPQWVSDHFCWTGIQGINTHDLLPLPYTEEAIQHIVSRIHRVQEFLGRQLLFENVSSYLSFSHSEFTEWEFITDITTRSGCGILLDINNVYVNAINHDFNPILFLQNIPAHAVKQFHVSGHQDCGTHLLDTHDANVINPVWNLYQKANTLFLETPLVIERDANIPPFNELLSELSIAKKITQEKIVPGVTSCSTEIKSRALAAPSLLDIQQNFFAFLQGNDETIIPSVVSTDQLSANSRLTIYKNGYYERFITALSQDFPVLKASLGARAFSSMIIHYMQKHPSSSDTLRWLGKNLSAFILACHHDFLPYADLAKLEWLLLEKSLHASQYYLTTFYNVLEIVQSFHAAEKIVAFARFDAPITIEV